MIRFSLSKLIMELVGTMLLTMFFSSASSSVILLGLWILNIFFWKISGSHFNPAVTFAYMFRKDDKKMGWKIALAYMVSQFLGAYVGALLLNFYTLDLP
jgi:glycerol uptake facilitator-like aquaporin|mmetsp:Transcript_615/g.817  ORF Transcript_615/g.817 Transcript_615/m.817 type:complete len:99 (+) Transcript_615:171-467(+)